MCSASSVDLHGASNTNVLRNNLRVRLSPIKSPVLGKYLHPFKRLSMYPSILSAMPRVATVVNNMQYVGQTCHKLKNRFGEHYRKIKKPKKIDTFLYQHFKRTGHSPDNVLVQPVEKLIYDENSLVRFNTIKRLETELKWIKLLQSASPLGFDNNFYQKGNISKMPDFDVCFFFLLKIRKRKRRSHGKRQKGNDKRKSCAAQKSGTSLNNQS